MDFKKYLIVLVFFVVGVLVGKNMSLQDPASNSASTLRSGVVTQDTTSVNTTPVVTNPSRTPVNNSTTVTNNQDQVGSTVKPTTSTISTDMSVTSNTDTNNAISKYAGINPLTKNMYKGNVSNDVVEVVNLQKFLIASGFLSGVADGKFGPMTQQAVIQFQLLGSVAPSVGYVGPKTRQLINQILVDPNYNNRQKPTCNCKNISGTPGMLQPGGACQASDNCAWVFPS